MTIRSRVATVALLLTIPAIAMAAPARKATPGATAKPAPVAPSAMIDKAAMAALDRSRAYLRTLTSAEMRAEMTVDDVEDDDLKLELTVRARYDFVKPDKLFIEWRSDRLARQLYFDGQTATLLAPNVGYYASVQQPGTVANMLTSAARDYGIVLPLPDLFLWAVQDAAPIGIQRAMVIGYARIAGVDTDQYVFRQPDIDWQIWIERGDHPLPRKIVITTRDDPAKPKFSALLQWNLDPQFAADQFTFKAPPGTAAVGIVKLNAAEK